jgi:hypothetical protein
MKHAINLALAAVGLLAMSGAAMALNQSSYNGSYCSSYFASDAGSFARNLYGIYNRTSKDLWVSCPVIVDEVVNTTGTSTTNVYYSGRGTIYCRLYSLNYNGRVRQSTSYTRSGTGWLYIPGLTSDDGLGSYKILCRLPGYGMINTIRLNERD